MRILHVADLHARWRWYDWLKLQAGRFDLVVVAGDLVDMLDDRTLGAQMREVSERIASFPGRVAICSGNHDAFLEQSADPNLKQPEWIQHLRSYHVIVDGDSVEVDGIRIEIAGWNCTPLLIEPTAIVVAHNPPAGVATATTGYEPEDLGDPTLREKLLTSQNAPWLVLSGHNHYPRRWYASLPRSGTDKIWSVVTGCQFGFECPAHLIIDTETRRAERVRGSTAEVVILSR